MEGFHDNNDNSFGPLSLEWVIKFHKTSLLGRCCSFSRLLSLVLEFRAPRTFGRILPTRMKVPVDMEGFCFFHMRFLWHTYVKKGQFRVPFPSIIYVQFKVMGSVFRRVP